MQAWSDPGSLRELRELLLQSRKPFVIAGGGGWTPQAAQALQRFAENWKLPVGNAFRFQDTFDNHHPLYAGDVGIGLNPKLAARIKDSDLVLAIGPRLGEMTTGGYTLLQAPKAGAEAGAHPRQRGGTQSRLPGRPGDQRDDERGGTLAGSADRATGGAMGRLDRSRARRLRGEPRAAGAAAADIDMPAIVAMLKKHLPADAVLTNGAGNFASWVHRFFKHHGLAKGLKTQLAPTVGAMGYGVPAGIAANLVSGRTVLTMAGDGDFLMNGQELATAAQYGAQEHHRVAEQRHVRDDPHAPGARLSASM